MESQFFNQQLGPNAQAQTVSSMLGSLLSLSSEALSKIDLLKEKIKEEEYVEARGVLEKAGIALNELLPVGNKFNELVQSDLFIKEWEENGVEATHLLSLAKAGRLLARSACRAEAEAELIRGKNLVKKGHWQKGKEILQGTLELFRKLGDWDGVARTFIEIGTVQTLFGDYEMAKYSLLDAERFFKKLNREDGIAFAELNLGSLALESYNYETARPHLKFASNFFHQTGDGERAKLSDDFLNLADEFERDFALV